MAILIAPGICRFALHGTYGNRPVVNIVDMKVDTTATLSNRAEVLYDVAGDLLNNWFGEVVNYLVCNDYLFTKVTWLDLDSATGSVGERSSTSQHTLPKPGALSLPPMPGNVALRVNKNTTARRGERQGRMYVCGIAEGLTDAGAPNMIVPGDLPAMNTAFGTFFSNITDETSFPEAGLEWHVIHTIDGVFQSSSKVTGLSVDPMVASQRRRLRG